MLAVLATLALAAAQAPAAPQGVPQAKLQRIELMPDLPRPYAMRDWKKVARDYDALVFDFDAKGQYLPLVWWDDTKHNLPIRGFGLPSYVGSPHQTHGHHHEAINCMAAVVGASLVGIDKSHQRGGDFVAMCQRYFNADNGANLYLNSVAHGTGASFWYETYPSLLFAQLMHLYPRTGRFARQLRLSADRMLGAVDALSGSDGVPDFNHTAFDYRRMAPVDNGRWTEPDAAAGYAWFLYVAHVRTGEAKYLDAADRCLRFLQRRRENPFYEVLMPYGAVAAARMNAELGRRYDVQKFLSWCFGPSDARRNWGVIVDRWGGLDAAGLSGSLSDCGGYGFAMNTFDAVATLAPLPRYDARYARAVGKYVLNAANAARLFYANAHDDAHQSSPAWARAHDPNACIAYEGCRKFGPRGTRTPYASGDCVGRPGRAATDLALYGASHVGYLAAVVEKTNVEGILQLDLLKTDWHHGPAHPTFLYYNPHAESKAVEVGVGKAPRDIYDAVARAFVARGVRGKTTVPLPPDSARVLVLVPAGSRIAAEGRKTLAGGVVIDYGQ